MMRRIARGIARRIVRAKDLTDGGERVDIDFRHGTPDWDRLDMYQRSHLRRYEFALTRVLPEWSVGDMACGTGYGTAMIASRAREAFGYDIDGVVVSAARRRYARSRNLTFVTTDLLAVTASRPFDMVVSFETVEHFSPSQIPDLFGKFGTLLRPGGTLMFSTPYLQPDMEASRRFHRTFAIDESHHRAWAEGGGFRVDQFLYQNYQTHDLAGAELREKDFVITLATRA